jgi:hypothetical protein
MGAAVSNLRKLETCIGLRLARRRGRFYPAAAMNTFGKKMGLWLAVAGLWGAPAAWAVEKVDRSYTQTARKFGFFLNQKVTFPGKITGKPIGTDKLEDELDRFFKALDALTVSFVKSSRLNVVMVVDDLKVDGKGAAGLAYGKVIYLQTGFSARVVYHELFHVVDDGPLAKSWAKLNPKSFVYKGSVYAPANLTGRKKTQMEKNEATGDMSLHFISDYAQSNEAEDRAETFAAMVSEGPKFLQRCERSEVIAKKMEYLKNLTAKQSLLGRDYWEKHFELTAPATSTAAKK